MARQPRKTSLARQATIIPFFTGKPLASGLTGYYWEPSPKLRRAGWTGLKLGTDQVAAITAAKARNDEVAAWETGGAKPAEVAKIVAPHTFGALKTRFWEEEVDDAARKADFRKPLAAATRREYQSYGNLLERWAEDGATPLVAITEARVKVLKTALFTAINARTGEVKIYRAIAALRHLNMLLEFGVAKKMIPGNPMKNVTIPAAPRRRTIVRPRAIVAVRESATALGREDVELGIVVGLWTLQRENDILKFNRAIWRECTDMDDASRRVLAGPDGKVMGFRVRPKKTENSSGAWVDIHATPDMRDRVDAAFAVNTRRAIPLTCLIADPDEPRATPDWKFQRGFRAAVNHAIAIAVQANDDELIEQLTNIKFADLRRTGMCLMRELGLSIGYIASVSMHSIDETTQILETYMPADSATNAAAMAMLATKLAARDAADREAERA